MNFIDPCAGVGGFSLGMMMAGHEPIAAYDNNPLAVEFYNRNLGHHAHLADLRQLRGADLPEADGIIGGPPCQALSNSNRTKNYGWNDPGNLVPEFVRLVGEKRPHFFIMENVTGILQYGHELSYEIGLLVNAGYMPVAFQLDAANYGVPQNRKRIFIVGVHHRLSPNPPNGTHPERDWVSMRAAIGTMLTEPETALPKSIRHLATGEDKAISFSNRTEVQGKKQFYWRSFDRPSFTVMAKGKIGKRRSSGAIDRAWVGGLAYKLLTQHNAALQSFPASFIWPEKHAVARTLYGNAVPPLLAMNVGKCL